MRYYANGDRKNTIVLKQLVIIGEESVYTGYYMMEPKTWARAMKFDWLYLKQAVKARRNGCPFPLNEMLTEI